MISEQVVPALLAALMGEGVSPEQIERAVSHATSLPPGRRISSLAPDRDQQLVRAFAFEQSRLLERM